jgi:hypothetical protein
MTHNLNHREQPVQKAGQTDGAALPPSPDPAAIFREGTTSVVPYGWGDRRASALGGRPLFKSSGAGRVAGGETMSQKTSTAALESLHHGPFPIQRRAPRHSTEAFVAPPFACPDQGEEARRSIVAPAFMSALSAAKSNFNS